MSQAQSQANALIWSDAKSIGSSREAYFGSITLGDEVISVQRINFVDQPDLWEISWNVGCDPVRKPQNPQHTDLYKAIAEAEAEVARLLAEPVPVCRACGLMLEFGGGCAIQKASELRHAA
jgi:hypothetical protein